MGNFRARMLQQGAIWGSAQGGCSSEMWNILRAAGPVTHSRSPRGLWTRKDRCFTTTSLCGRATFWTDEQKALASSRCFRHCRDGRTWNVLSFFVEGHIIWLLWLCQGFRTLPGFAFPFWTGDLRSRLCPQEQAEPWGTCVTSAQALTKECSYSERGTWKGSRQGEHPEDLLCCMFYSIGIAWFGWICVGTQTRTHTADSRYIAWCLWGLISYRRRGETEEAEGEGYNSEGRSVLWWPLGTKAGVLSPCLWRYCPCTGMPTCTSPG